MGTLYYIWGLCEMLAQHLERLRVPFQTGEKVNAREGNKALPSLDKL